MNYLSHFYVNLRRGSYSPEFHLGAALPDLFSAYDRRLRFASHTVQSHRAHALVPDLWPGILNHLDTDARFHRSGKFKTTFEEVRQLMIAAVPAGMNCRPFFLAHIAVEMLLDHLLLKKDPGLAEHFYRTLSKIDRNPVHCDLKIYFDSDLDKFENHFQRFLDVRFLENYDRIDQLWEFINRMLKRTRQDAFTGNGVLRLNDALAQAADRMEKDPSILDDF